MHGHESSARICLVCFHASTTGPDCAECGWRPKATDPVVNTRLERAQRVFDATAAARVSPANGRELPQIRGGKPDDTEWSTALRAATARTDPPSALEDLLEPKIVGLPDGGRLNVIEVGREGITTTLVGYDGLGILRSRTRPTVGWTELVPMLPADTPEELLFRLAGGFGGVDRTALWSILDRTVPGSVKAGHVEAVLVCTAAGWPVPEHAVTVLGARLTATAIRLEAVPVDELVTRLISLVPLRNRLELVVAVAQPTTRTITLRGSVLFYQGARIGDETVLSLRCAHADPAGTVFTVVTWHEGRPRPLSIDSLALRPGTHEVRMVLADHGEVRIEEPAGATPDQRTWPELVDALPKRLTEPVAELSLVCLIDLSGNRFEARRELVRELVDLLWQECPEPGRLTVSVIGYGDHVYEPGREEDRVVSGSWLRPPDQALTVLDRLRQVERGPLPVAPVEDALARVAAGVGGIPAGRRMVLLTVGDRPPHPATGGNDGVLPCPKPYDWQELLRVIERRPALTTIAVLDEIRDSDPAWRRLGRTATHPSRSVTAQRLAMDIGVLTPPAQMLPFPLLETPGSR